MKGIVRKTFVLAIVVIAIVSMFTVSASALAGYSGYCYDVDARNNAVIQTYHGTWAEDGVGAKFICDDGSYLTGWWKIGQNSSGATWRFFSDDGYLVRGWAGFDALDRRVWSDAQVIRSRYFDQNDGHLYEGYQTIVWNGVSYNYYFGVSLSGNYRNGILLKNAQAPNGAWADANGVLQWSNGPGGQVVNPSQQICPITGEAANNQSYLGTWVPYQADQSYPGQASGTSTTNTGWIKVGSYYRHYTNGKLDKGLTVISGYTYYFDNSGNMTTGWKSVGGNYRYFDKSTGIMYFGGWAQIDNYSYYFDASGINLRDAITPDGYYVDRQGRWDGKTRLSIYAPGYGGY